MTENPAETGYLPPPPARDASPACRPLDSLEVLATQDVQVGSTLSHIELFTPQGLLAVLWHGPRDSAGVVVACGGALGGLLGPAGGLYHDLGIGLADQGIGLLRVGYRQPNNLAMCIIDVAAAADLAARHGGTRFVVIGHSFGGAVAINVAAALGPVVVGVVTLASQAAGCGRAKDLADCSLLMFHGDRDEVLPVTASEMIQSIAPSAELVVVEGAGHLLTEARHQIRSRLRDWIPAVLDASGR